MRRFTQTFVLAAQAPKTYYVHNDIFRYQDLGFPDEEENELEAVESGLGDSTEQRDEERSSEPDEDEQQPQTQQHSTTTTVTDQQSHAPLISTQQQPLQQQQALYYAPPPQQPVNHQFKISPTFPFRCVDRVAPYNIPSANLNDVEV